MNRVILIKEEEGGLLLRLLEDDLLVEQRRFVHTHQPQVKDIVLGRVSAVSQAMKALFVDIGLEKDAFLPADHLELDTYRPGMELIVQLQRSPSGPAEAKQDLHKGAMVTLHYSLHGRYVVLTPFDPRLSLSKKITNPEDRERLLAVGATLVGIESCGYILRTAAQEADASDIKWESEKLYATYLDIQKKAAYSPVGTVLFQGESTLSSFMESLSDAYISVIYTDSKQALQELGDSFPASHWVIRSLRAEEESRLLITSMEKSLRDQASNSQKTRLSFSYPLETDRKQACVSSSMKGYLFFEKTMALTSIDVNTGKELLIPKGVQSKEEWLYQVNRAAAESIVNQIRLRNLGGQILIDFVHMKSAKMRTALHESMQRLFENDHTPVTLYGFTKGGLYEINRPESN